MSRSRWSILSSSSRAEGSFPSCQSARNCSSAPAVSPAATLRKSCAVRRFPARPMAEMTASVEIHSFPQHWSSSVSASRIPPSAMRASSAAASGCRSRCSCCATKFRRAVIVSTGMRLKLCRWQRDKIVAGTLCSSVVARMNMRCSGGSSRIFSRALNAELLSMCTSSTIYTRLRTLAGENTASSRRARTLSTPLLDAASSSTTSRTDPSSMPRQAAHWLHGLPLTGCSQLTALARILAQVVLPVPRVPMNR